MLGLAEGGARESKFRPRRATRLGVFVRPGVRPPQFAEPGDGVKLQKSAKLKFCPGVWRAPLNRPKLLPGVFIMDEGRWACCDGGVVGGSFDELEIWVTLIAGERDGELAR